MVTITLSNGLNFDSAATELLLDAAARGNVTMAYSCRTGRCSTCKCKVISGGSTALHQEMGLTEQERSDGWILSCVRTPNSDMVLEVQDLGGVTLPPIKTVPCRINVLEKLAPDVIRVVLRLSPTCDFAFLPGQYIDVIGQAGLRRSYSLANASPAAKLLELQIRAVPDGEMSNYWFNHAKVNDLLRLTGPKGTFFLRNISGMDLVFLATGTGIAPVKAMLESIDALSKGRPRSLAVYWGGRHASDLYWDVSGVGNVQRYVPVLSRAGNEWDGARGHVQEAFLAGRPDLSETIVYACGSNAMIQSAKELLLEAGLPERRFLSDAFVCSAVS